VMLYLAARTPSACQTMMAIGMQTHVFAKTIRHPSLKPTAILISKSESLRPKLAVGKA